MSNFRLKILKCINYRPTANDAKSVKYINLKMAPCCQCHIL